MDSHDVSDDPRFMQLLLGQKQSVRDAQSRMGQRPTGGKSRYEAILQFRSRFMTKQAKLDLSSFQIRSSIIPPAYPPCVRSFHDLTKVMIKDLLLETHHRGTYILLRSVTPADRMTAVLAVVEDENQEVVMVQLYNQQEEIARAAEEILGEGTVVIVKEPYFKLMSDGNYGIRVDHLSDVIHLPIFDERIPTSWQRRVAKQDLAAGAWKTKGNDCFNQSKYDAAIEYYTKALDCSPTAEEVRTLKLNRSLAFLKTNKFDAALADLESTLTTPNPAEKALFRKAQALYSLRRYRESCDVLKDLRLKYPSNADAKALFTRAISRLAEQEHGRYRFKQLYAEATKLRPPHLDHSTYVGPVSVRATGSKGRGLFTTKAVRAGDLLLCEKAFAHAFVDTENSWGDVTILINAETSTMTMGTQAELIRLVVQKLYRNPSLASVFTDLHHGSYKPVGASDVDGTPLVDTFLVERIVSLNAFGCPLFSRETHLHATEASNTSQNTDGKLLHSSGIWPMASYINHCCCSNARRAFIGDMMVVRATRDLAPDTEITFWYHSPDANSYNERQRKFRMWGFNCDCAMCKDDQTTNKTVLVKRKSLRAQVEKLLQCRKRTDTAKLEDILDTIANTYKRPAFEVPRLSVWDGQLALAEVYMQRNQPVKAIDAILRALASLGYVIDGGHLPHATRAPMVVKQWGLLMDNAINCWGLLSSAYRQAAPDLEAQAVEYARLSYRMCVGEDETFSETYGKSFGLNVAA